MEISYSDVEQLVPGVPHIYAGVTREEIAAIDGSKYVTELNGVVILGTLTPVEELQDRELIKPAEEEPVLEADV